MLKEYNFTVGNDNGNSEHDLIINGELIRQPNVYAKVRKLPMLEQLKEDLIIKDIEKKLVVTMGGKEPGNYLIGDFALESGAAIRSIEVGVDNNKIGSNIVLVNTLAQIAGYACKKYYEEVKNLDGLDKEEIVVNIDMATALPIKQYSTQNAMLFSNKLIGIHDVLVHIGAYKVRVKINVSFVKTIPEGVTASWALQQAENDDIFKEYNKEAEAKDKLSHKTFKTAKILHVSIGEGTTEIPVTKGIEFDPNFIRGIDNGIGHAIDKSLEEFIENFGLSNYSRQNFSEIMKTENHKYFAVATDIAADYIEEQAEQILHAVKQEVQKANNEIDYIVVYGGGSILMKDFLEKKLKAYTDRAMIKLFYVSECDAVTLEVKGLYAFASSQIFDRLKEKNKG